ncbi:MAG: acyl-CoA dehydrogenase [Candidatus Lindowbacteria bacterium]|nr:acyl-CoA dehydrogenase [Candidatus Lindowbacteria bacterium]
MSDSVTATASQNLFAFYNTYVESTKHERNSWMQTVFEGKPKWSLCPKVAQFEEDRVELVLSGMQDQGFLHADVFGIPETGDTAALPEICEGLCRKASAEPRVALDNAYHGLGVLRVLSKFASKNVRVEIRREGGIMAFGLTEEETGSDVSGLTSTAIRRGNYWHVKGRKTLVVNATKAQWFLVFVKTESDAGSSLSAFLLDKDQCNVVDTSHSASGLSLATVEFNATHVDESFAVGEIGKGSDVLQYALDGLWVAAAAIATGISSALVVRANVALAGRQQFGKPLTENSVVQEKLALLNEKEYAGRAMWRLAAWMGNADQDFSAEAACAKVMGTELNRALSEQAGILMGGKGCVDPELERMLLAARELQFIGGANDVTRFFISLYSGRPTIQFIIDTDIARKRITTWLDATGKKVSRWVRHRLMRVKIPKLHSSLAEPAGILCESSTILGDRAYQVFSYFKNDVASHPYELHRIANIAIEVYALWSVIWHSNEVLSGRVKGDETKSENFPKLRAVRAWPEIARNSKELYLSDEKVIEKVCSV